MEKEEESEEQRAL